MYGIARHSGNCRAGAIGLYPTKRYSLLESLFQRRTKIYWTQPIVMGCALGLGTGLQQLVAQAMHKWVSLLTDLTQFMTDFSSPKKLF